MVENGYVKAEDGEAAKKTPLAVTARTTGSHIFAASFFAEEVRREIYDRYGRRSCTRADCRCAPHSIPSCSSWPARAQVDGMIRYDERAGYRGAVQKLDISGDWGVKLSDIMRLSDIGWKLAVVLETSDQSARIGFQPPREPGGAVVRERRVGIVPLEGVKWAKAAAGPQRGKVPAKLIRCSKPAT